MAARTSMQRLVIQKKSDKPQIFAAKVYGTYATCGQTLWQRSRAMAAPGATIDGPGNSLEALYCWEFAAYKLQGLSGRNVRPTFVASVANLPGKAHCGWPSP